MKIRTGHVSNSSSSSFIIGIGKIKNQVAFDKFCKDKGMRPGVGRYEDISVHTGKDLKEVKGWGASAKTFSIHGGNYTDITVFKGKLDSEEKYVIVNIGNNEGDCYPFVVEDEDGEYGDLNYDAADYNYFEELGQAKYIDLFLSLIHI